MNDLPTLAPKYALTGQLNRYPIDPAWLRTDCPDGYTEFRNAEGRVVALFCTALLVPA